LLLLVQERAYQSPDVVRFLRPLLRPIPGKRPVIWEGAPIHRGQPVQDCPAHGGAKRIRLEPLPGYAPASNPDEGIWHSLKRVELRDVRCRDLKHRRRELRWATARLRPKRHLIRGCATQAGYHVEAPVRRSVS
jgi:transposase